MIKRMGVLAFIFSAWISMVIPGILIAQEVPSPPCAGCGGVPTTPKPFMVIPPSPLVSPTIPNALEYDGTNLWLTGKNGTRGSVFSGNAPSEFNNTVTFGSSGILDFNTGSVINFADGSVWKSTGLIFGSGTSLSFPDGSAWDSSGLIFGTGGTETLPDGSKWTSGGLTFGTSGTETLPDGSKWSSGGLTFGNGPIPFFSGNNTLILGNNVNTVEHLCIGTVTGTTCTHTIPSNISILHIRLIGDGAGGGGNDTASGGSGGGGGASPGGILWNLPVTNGEVIYYSVGGGGPAGTSGTAPTSGGFNCGTFMANFIPVSTSCQALDMWPTSNTPPSSSQWYLVSGPAGISYIGSGSTVFSYSGQADGGANGSTSGSTGNALAGCSLASGYSYTISSFYSCYPVSGQTLAGQKAPGNGIFLFGLEGGSSPGTSGGVGGINPLGWCNLGLTYINYNPQPPSLSGYGCGGYQTANGMKGIIIIQY